jgi:hypothetical protein
MNRFTRLLAGDQLIGSNGESSSNVESIEGRETKISRYAPSFFEKIFLEGSPRLDFPEKLLIEGSLSSSSVKKCLRNDLKTNEGARGKISLGIIQNGQCRQRILEVTTSSGYQHTRIDKSYLQRSRSLTPPRRSATSRSMPSLSSKGSPEATICFRSSQRRRPRGVLG